MRPERIGRDTHPTLRIDLLKIDLNNKSPEHRSGAKFCWQFGAFFGFGRSRDQGKTLPRTRFTPSALVPRSGDPNRTMLVPFLDFWAPLESRSPLKVDHHGGPCRIRSTFKGGCVFPPCCVSYWRRRREVRGVWGREPRRRDTHLPLKVDRMRHGPPW